MESVDATVDQVIAILNDFMPPESVVRIGNGSPTISSRIANVCLARGLSVQFVDETRLLRLTSRPCLGSSCNLYKGRSSSYRTSTGNPNRGEVREIQRRSRSISEGRLTIPSQLARPLLLGG